MQAVMQMCLVSVCCVVIGVVQKECSSMDEVIELVDVLYMTRMQKERFASEEEYKQTLKNGLLVLTPQLMRRAKERSIIMHPLPRNDEISPALDTDPRAAYFRQAEFGLYVRMALLLAVLGQFHTLLPPSEK